MKFLADYTNMQIHPCSPQSPISAEDAATKIQAGFRGYRVRKQLKENSHKNYTTSPGDENHTQENNENVHNNNINHIILTNEKNRLGECPMNVVGVASAEDKSAAIRIQASVRGYLVRKKQKMVSSAATKIQAGFRGFRTRKELRKLKA